MLLTKCFGTDPEGYESAQSANTESVPDLEPDFIDEVGKVDPDDPTPFGEPSDSSGDEEVL